jgi:uncharacterized protein (TIGR03435 family)
MTLMTGIAFHFPPHTLQRHTKASPGERMKVFMIVLGMVVIAVAVMAAAQSSRPQFEVASVKRNYSGSRASNCCGGAGRLVGTNVTLGMLINTAYKVQDFQVTGAPAWVNSDRYDIQATADEKTASLGTAILQGPMLQSLLEDRFKLVVRREMRELPVYELTVAKGGSKLKAGACSIRDPNSPPRSQRPSDCGFSVMDNNMIRATQIDMARFVPMLTFWVRRTVINKTGFTGTFDVDLKWNPDEAAGAPSPDTAPSIFTAIQEQLGLKLERSKGPVEVLVIDSVSKPTEN